MLRREDRLTPQQLAAVNAAASTFASCHVDVVYDGCDEGPRTDARPREYYEVVEAALGRNSSRAYSTRHKGNRLTECAIASRLLEDWRRAKKAAIEGAKEDENRAA